MILIIKLHASQRARWVWSKSKLSRMQCCCKRTQPLQVLEEVQTLATGVTGVPYFIIDNKFSLSGAQEAETFAKVFEKL